MISASSIYEALVDEEDARACAELSASACRETPRNFGLILCAQLATKLADSLASPKTVLPWVLAGAQVPVALTGLLVPIRESGSMIPQLAIAGRIRRLAVRKWVWVFGSLTQAACVIGIGVVAVSLVGAAAGIAIIGLLAMFSIARGFCSVASKDVLGKTVPKKRRGRLTGWSASGAGLLSIAVGLALLSPLMGLDDARVYSTLLVAAGILWLGGAAVFARIVESPGETDGGRNAVEIASRSMSLLVADKPFRAFVIARAFLLCSALSAPYYILLARDLAPEQMSSLGLFIVAGGLASFLAAPVWGRFADRSSRKVMATAGLLSGSIGVCVFGVVELLPGLAAHAAFIPAAFFCLSIAHDGVRVGRKTYVVDLAGGNKRTDYVAVSNTVIGVVLLVAGLAGTLSNILSLAGIILLLSVFGLAGAWLSMQLQET